MNSLNVSTSIKMLHLYLSQIIIWLQWNYMKIAEKIFICSFLLDEAYYYFCLPLLFLLRKAVKFLSHLSLFMTTEETLTEILKKKEKKKTVSKTCFTSNVWSF